MRRLLPWIVVCATLACSEVTVPNYNTPNADDLLVSPSKPVVTMAAVGLQIRLRELVGYEAVTLGVFGKEAYILSEVESQLTTVFLRGPMVPGSFGENVGWGETYGILKQSALVLAGMDRVPDFVPAEREGMRGFVKTVMAMALFTQVRIRDTAGIVLEVPVDYAVEPAPIVTPAVALDHITALLDEARAHLESPDAVFPFVLHSGFTGFSTPTTFLRLNRAIHARVQVYRRDWASALQSLAESFVDTSAGTTAVLRAGAYHVYSTAQSDARNGMLSPTFFVNRSILSGAQQRPNGQPDLRLTQKTASRTPVTVAGVQGTHRFIIYPTNTTAVPIIRNEELILLRAEARYFSGDVVGALNDINFIRVSSGGLAAIAGFADETAFVDELLYNRTYSLLLEGGHRWVDARRHGRLAQLPKTTEGEVTFRYMTLPRTECVGRSPAPQPGCSAAPQL